MNLSKKRAVSAPGICQASSLLFHFAVFSCTGKCHNLEESYTCSLKLLIKPIVIIVGRVCYNWKSFGKFYPIFSTLTTFSQVSRVLKVVNVQYWLKQR